MNQSYDEAAARAEEIVRLFENDDPEKWSVFEGEILDLLSRLGAYRDRDAELSGLREFGFSEYLKRPEPVPDYADLMTKAEWIAAVEDPGLFVPDDGAGHWATKTVMDTTTDSFDKAPKWATHVAWFNK